jgi:hypothetical protein
MGEDPSMPPFQNDGSPVQHLDQRHKCFVIMPFRGHWDKRYINVYAKAITASGLEPVRADRVNASHTILETTWRNLQESDIALADLTEKNPNVYYELGLAHAMLKPVILIAPNPEYLPADMRAIRVIEYDIQDDEWGLILKNRISETIRDILKNPADSILLSPFRAVSRDETPVDGENPATVTSVVAKYYKMRLPKEKILEILSPILAKDGISLSFIEHVYDQLARADDPIDDLAQQPHQ